jgi:hypothetical protein
MFGVIVPGFNFFDLDLVVRWKLTAKRMMTMKNSKKCGRPGPLWNSVLAPEANRLACISILHGKSRGWGLQLTDCSRIEYLAAIFFPWEAQLEFIPHSSQLQRICESKF